MKLAKIIVIMCALLPLSSLAAVIATSMDAKPASVCQRLNGNPYQVQAVISADHSAKLSSQITAYIDSIPFKEGDTFKKGDTLVKFDCSLQKSELSKARAQLKSARATYKANRRLHGYGGVSVTELAESQAKYEEAQAEVAGKQHVVKYCTVKAPYDGTVVKLNVQPHETVPQSEPMLEIINNTDLRIEFIVSSKWLSWMKVGSKFKLCVSEQQQSYPGKVMKIVPQIDAVSQSIKIIGKLDKTNKKLIAGMSGKAIFEP